mmetsp:Transcript_105183/g.279972  ORF Transcript_105183/g.279972 Transcript_105183/m.279972 type:complete len:102 (+) Transcript_105183:513-818(+)
MRIPDYSVPQGTSLAAPLARREITRCSIGEAVRSKRPARLLPHSEPIVRRRQPKAPRCPARLEQLLGQEESGGWIAKVGRLQPLEDAPTPLLGAAIMKACR